MSRGLNISPKKVKQIFEDYSRIFPEIDWDDPEAIIAFHQSIYRLFSLVNSEFKILHGSATITPRGKVIVFGDSGKSIGKTTCAHEIARHSKKWIADEFVLYFKGKIYANGEYPLHFKEGSKVYFKDIKKKFTNWIYPKKQRWSIIDDVCLSAIVCPQLGDTAYIRQLIGKEAAFAKKNTAYAHLAKLLYPSLDRFSVFTRENSQEAVVKDLASLTHSFGEFKERIPIYEMRISKTADIIPLLKKVKLY